MSSRPPFVIGGPIARGPAGAVKIGEVNTVEPDEPADVIDTSDDPTVAVLDFAIPRGEQGLPGVNAVPTAQAVAAYMSETDPDPEDNPVPATLKTLYARGRSVSAEGATGDNATNEAPAFLASVATDGQVWVPTGTHRIQAQVDVDESVNLTGETTATTILNFDGIAGYGLNYQGPGLGGSAQDGAIIERLNLWGSATSGLLRLYGVGLARIRNLIAQNTSNPVLVIDTCQDMAVQDIDVFGGGNDTASEAGATLRITGSNNVYIDRVRNEAPHGTAVYVAHSDNVELRGGKVDGNAATPSTLPFVVSDDSGLRLDGFKLNGAAAEPVEVKGHGTIVFTNGCEAVESTADAVVKAADTYYTRRSTGYQPGVILGPSITFRDFIVRAESVNTPGRNIEALIKVKAPDPRYIPAGTTGRVDVKVGPFMDGTNLKTALHIQSATTSTYGEPGVNDLYTGAWLVHVGTGARLRVAESFADGLTILDGDAGDAAAFPTGATYRLEYREQDGVEVHLDNVRVQYRTKRSVFNPVAQIGTVTVTASAYSDGTTTLTVSEPLTADAWNGYYLTDGTDSWRIAGTGTGALLVDYDQTAAIPNGTYAVQAGKVWSGSVEYVA